MDGTQEIMSTQEAEKAAMDKVTDIYNTPLYKHAFNRNPINYNIEHDGIYYPQTEAIDTSVDRLKGIIKTGLLSDKIAERIGQKISKNYSDSNNNTHVSLSPERVEINNAFWAAFPPPAARLDASGNQKDIPEPSAEEVFVLLIDPNIVPTDTSRSFRVEVLKKFRVKQESFAGIVILDRPLNRNVGGTQFQDNELHPEKVAREIGQLQKDTYGPDTKKYFPVYGNSGDLYWPKRMSYEELKTQEKV
jgi:hypothetical protein